MKLKDSINYAFTKAIRNKKNIYFIVILAICTVTILGAIYYRTTFLKRIEYSENHNFRSYSVFAPDQEYEKYFEDKNYIIDFDKILDIDHVEDIYDFKYNHGVAYTDTYKNNKYTGTLWLKYGSDATLPKNVEGKRFYANDTGVAICSKYFYPSNGENINYFDKNMFLKTDDIINKTFNIKREIVEKKDEKSETTGIYRKDFKIIGVFDPLDTNDKMNTCYISPLDAIDFYESVNKTEEDYSLTPMNVIIDSVDNIKYVTNELTKMGFSFSPNAYIEYNDIINIKYISNLIIMITLFAIMILTILYVDKKNINEQYEIGLLKSLGYKNKDIQLIKFMEMIWITIISFIIGLLLIGITLFIINTIFKNYLIYHHIIIYHNVIPYILVFGIIVLLPLASNYYCTYKNSKKKVINMIKEGSL